LSEEFSAPRGRNSHGINKERLDIQPAVVAERYRMAWKVFQWAFVSRSFSWST